MQYLLTVCIFVHFILSSLSTLFYLLDSINYSIFYEFLIYWFKMLNSLDKCLKYLQPVYLTKLQRKCLQIYQIQRVHTFIGRTSLPQQISVSMLYVITVPSSRVQHPVWVGSSPGLRSTKWSSQQTCCQNNRHQRFVPRNNKIDYMKTNVCLFYLFT